MFLEGVLIVTNMLSLLLQSDKKDFSSITPSVNRVIENLKNIEGNIYTNRLKIFNNANKKIEKM